MRILAIETSTEYCSVALLDDNALHTYSELAGQRHSEILLPMIDQLLAEAGCSLQQLDALAFGAGPGSFTGVRIAASVAQGLAFGVEIPVLPVCTLEALAEASGLESDADKIACALDARLDEVYFAAYQRHEHHWQAVVEPCLAPIGALGQLPGTDWRGVGSGFGILDGQLARHLQLGHIDASPVPQASAIATLAKRSLQAGGGLDAAQAQPVYLRNKVAMTITERHARGYK